MSAPHPRRVRPWLGLLLAACGCATPGYMGSPAPPRGVPHDRPTVSGKQLGLAPGETATEKALDLAQKLRAAEDERRALLARIEKLDATVQERDRAIEAATRELQAARDEITRTRTELARWRVLITTLRDRLRTTEKDNLDALRQVVSLLERLLEPERPPEPGPELKPGPEPRPEPKPEAKSELRPDFKTDFKLEPPELGRPQPKLP